MSRELPINCLGEETRCLVYSGDPIPALDIRTGDALNYVLRQLANTPTAVAEEAKVFINTFNIPVLSSCAIKLVGYKYNYSITPSLGGIIFSWDILNTLPAGYGFTSTTVDVIGSGKISSSNSRSASSTIPLSSLPANVIIQQIVNTPCGDVVLSKTVPVTASLRGSYTGVLEVKDLNNTPAELSVEQAIEMALAMSVQNLQRIDDFQAIHTLSQLDVLSSRITTLEGIEPSTSTTYVDNGVTKTNELSTVLSELYSLLRANEAYGKLLKNEIDALKILISQVS